MATMIRSVLARLRRGQRRVVETLTDLRPPRQTALQLPADRMPPPDRSFARFGSGSWIVAPASIVGAAGIEIGVDVEIAEMSTIDVAVDGGARLVIGDRCRLGSAFVVDCALRVELGSDVHAASQVAITDRGAGNIGEAPVVIGDHVRLGCGSIIGPGVRIGRGAVVAPGAVVFDDVPPGSVVVGNPAVAVSA